MNVSAAIAAPPRPASSHHLAAFAAVTGTITGPPKTSFITSKSFSTEKLAFGPLYDATFRIPAHMSRTTIPDLSNIWAVRAEPFRQGTWGCRSSPTKIPCEQDAAGLPSARRCHGGFHIKSPVGLNSTRKFSRFMSDDSDIC